MIRAAKHDLHREELSREVCRRLEWRNGGLMSARVAMLHMHRNSLLPPPRHAPAVRPCPVLRPERPLFPNVSPMSNPWSRSADEGRIWNEFIARLPRPLDAARRGATSHAPLTASRSPPSTSVPQHRPTRTGSWDPETHRRNLPLVVDNAGALPWVRSKNLASPCRGRMSPARRLGRRVAPGGNPLREPEGTCSANWTKVGRTQGRGKLDNERNLPVNWLKPLPGGGS